MRGANKITEQPMDNGLPVRQPWAVGRKLMFLVTEDWYFCSHRLPIARAARDAGFEVVVATRVDRHGDRIRDEGFRLISLPWRRSSKNLFRELRTLLGDEGMVLSLIKEELQEISDRYGDERRTEIIFGEGEIDIEDLIADQQMVIAITRSGYIKSLPLATYRQQRRGGVGVTGMDLKEDDYIEHLFVCSTHNYLLFFTNRGKVYRSKVYDIPEASRTAKGRYLGNILPLRDGERVQSVLATRDYGETDYLVFATRKGMIKKTKFPAYNTPIKADGIIAIKIRDDDELVAVRPVSKGDHIIMVSRNGRAATFKESEARAMGRDTSGVRGQNVSQKSNYVLAMDVARADQELLVVTEHGYGKRTPITEYPVKGRGAMGVS